MKCVTRWAGSDFRLEQSNCAVTAQGTATIAHYPDFPIELRVLAPGFEYQRFRGVRLSQSQALGSPVALSRREICIPRRAQFEMSAGEQQGMLAHELAHLVRRDPAWLRIAHVIERMFFFQPLNRLQGLVRQFRV